MKVFCGRRFLWAGEASPSEGQGERADGAQVGRDIVTGASITACGAAGQLAVFVAKGDGNAVDLRLEDPLDFFLGQEFGGACDKTSEFLEGVGVVEAEHRDTVRDGLKSRKRRPTDATARRVLGNQVRMGALQLDQLGHQPVVFGVADYRGGFDVVGVIVTIEFFFQLAHARGDLRGFHVAGGATRRRPARRSAE